MKNWLAENKVKALVLLLTLLTSLGVSLSPDARNTVGGWFGISNVDSASASAIAPVSSD